MPLTQVRAELWIPSNEPKRVEAYRCRIRTHTVCTRVGVLGPFGGRSVVSDDVILHEVTPVECITAIHQHVWQNVSLTEQQPGLWTTDNSLEVQYKYCCYDFCQSVSNFVLEKGEVSTLNNNHLASDLGNVGGCSAVTGYCRLGDGIILWNATELSDICPFEYFVFQVATLNDQHVLFDDLQVAFSFPTNPLPVPACVQTAPSKLPAKVGLPQSKLTE